VQHFHKKCIFTFRFTADLVSRRDYDVDNVPVLILRLSQLKILNASLVERYQAKAETIETKMKRLKPVRLLI